MAKDDIYVSVDIEADGPIPGPHSMLSIGAAAFRPGERRPLATFEINLAPLPGSSPDPDTLAWWAKQDPSVWLHSTQNPVEPGIAMHQFRDWVRGLGGTPVLVVYPTWDAMWTTWYFTRFCGPHSDPFGIGGLDLKSMSFGMFPEFERFKDVTKRALSAELFEGCPPHTHKALDDAIGQGVWFVNLLARRSGLTLPKNPLK